MGKYVAIIDAIDTFSSRSTLKRAALLFDHIALSGLDGLEMFFKHFDDPAMQPMQNWIQENDWLRKNGVLIDPPMPPDYKDQLNNVFENLMQSGGTGGEYFATVEQMLATPNREKIITAVKERMARRAAARLSNALGWNAVLVSTQKDTNLALLDPGKDSVAKVIFQSIPELNIDTPWETIVDYREDSAARGKFFRLKNWINGLANQNKTPSELEDELRELINEYEEYMKLHKMKFSTGVVETVVTVGAEFAEAMVKFKWSKAAKALFTLKHQKISLLEAERGAPGREIAYLIDVKEKFSTH